MITRFRLTVFLILAMASAPVHASADGDRWSTPVKLSDTGYAYSPLIKTDAYGGVHVVWAEGNADRNTKPNVIYYSRLDQGGWTVPVDIVATNSPDRTVIPSSLATDNQGYLILLWQENNSLLLSRAPVEEAGVVHSWSTPVVVQLASTESSGGSLQVAPDGSYHLVFVRNNRELVYAASLDYGTTWPHESLVAQASSAAYAIGDPHLVVDSTNHRYAAWTQHSEATDWAADGVWFSRSSDGGITWSSAEPISSDSGHGWPSLFLDSRGRLYLTWIGNLASGGRYQVTSDDCGVTFGPMTTIATSDQLRGYAGRPQVAEDSRSSIHVVFGGTGSGAPDSIWYTRKVDNTWLPLLDLSPLSPDSQAPATDIELGHFLHVVWVDYSDNGVYYSGVDTGSSPQSAAQHPVRAPSSADATDVSVETASAIQEATTPTAMPDRFRSHRDWSGSSEYAGLAWGALPAVLIVATVTAISLLRRSNR